jgi:hypothetical protein
VESTCIVAWPRDGVYGCRWSDRRLRSRESCVVRRHGRRDDDEGEGVTLDRRRFGFNDGVVDERVVLETIRLSVRLVSGQVVV